MESTAIKKPVRRPSLRLNAVSNWVLLGVNVIVGFLLTPLIIGQVGKTGYGIWTLIGSFIGYYGLLNLGVESAITRYVARYAGQGDDKSLNETASSAMVMFCCTGVLAIVASLFLAGVLAGFFEVEAEYLDDFRYVVWIIGLATGLTFPGNVFRAIVCAHEKFVAVNCAGIAATLVRAGLIVYLLICGVGLVGISLATLAGQLVALVSQFVLYRILTPNVRIRCSLSKWRVLRTLIVYGSITTVIVVANILRTNIAAVIIGKCVNMSAVGVYGVAALIIRYITNVITAGMGVLTPRFAALDGAKEHGRLQSLFLRSLSISALLAFAMCALGIIFGDRFITLWVGEEFSEAVPVLWVLCGSYAFALAQNPAIGAMYALNKHYFFGIATLIEALTGVILGVMLASKYGMLGVAIGLAIPMLVIRILVMPVYVSRIVGVGILEYLRPLAIPSALGGLMVAVWWMFEPFQFLDGYAWGGLGICGAAAGLFFVAAVLVISPVLGLPSPRGPRLADPRETKT